MPARKLVATVDELVKSAVTDAALTFTVSVREPILICALTVAVSATWILIVCSCVANPASSKTTL